MRETPLLLFALTIAFLAIVVSGGPDAAADIRRDDARIADIQALAFWSDCENIENPDAFRKCRKPDRTEDPFTGAPYVREANPDRWCATLERPQDSRPGTSEGCVLVRP